MDKLYIFKNDIPDKIQLESFINLYNCRLAYEDDLYYTIEGSAENIKNLRQHVQSMQRTIDDRM